MQLVKKMIKRKRKIGKKRLKTKIPRQVVMEVN